MFNTPTPLATEIFTLISTVTESPTPATTPTDTPPLPTALTSISTQTWTPTPSPLSWNLAMMDLFLDVSKGLLTGEEDEYGVGHQEIDNWNIYGP